MLQAHFLTKGLVNLDRSSFLRCLPREDSTNPGCPLSATLPSGRCGIRGVPIARIIVLGVDD